MEAVDETAGRTTGMRAAANLDQTFFHSHGHPLIEDKAFALPMLISKLLLVGRDPAMKLEDVFESLLPEECRRFLAPDPSRAIHQKRFFLQALKAFCEFWQLAKMLDVAD